MEPKLLNLPFQLRVVRLQGRALGLEPLYLSRQLSIEWMVFRPFSGDGLDVLFVPLQGPFAVPRVHETLPMGLRPPGRGVVMVRNSGSLCLPGPPTAWMGSDQTPAPSLLWGLCSSSLRGWDFFHPDIVDVPSLV